MKREKRNSFSDRMSQGGMLKGMAQAPLSTLSRMLWNDAFLVRKFL